MKHITLRKNPMSIESEFENRSKRELIRVVGGLPNGAYPANPRAGTIQFILKESSDRISAEIARATREGKAFGTLLKNQIDGVLSDTHGKLDSTIQSAMVKQWNLADEKNTRIVINQTRGLAVPATMATAMNQLNPTALSAFLNRSDRGFTLSDRIWLLMDGNREKINKYLASGIVTGRSAAGVSRDVRKLLVDPDKLFRRVRNPDTGELIESARSQSYNPGTGKYKSSYMNALRLAATEINMSYRMSDFMRRKKLPNVIGVRVNLSPSHPRPDICDAMVGAYPKGFLFMGFHPLCICYTTAILMSRNELRRYFKTHQKPEARIVRSIPKQADEYVKTNLERFRGYKRQPYWLRDNFKPDGSLMGKVTECCWYRHGYSKCDTYANHSRSHG